MNSALASKPFPGFDHLWLLGEGPTSFRAETDWPGGDEDHRRTWRRLTRGEIRPPVPVPFGYAMGRAIPGDVVWTTNVFPLMVHMRVVDLLLDHRLTGWGTYPVELRGKEGEALRDYVGFAITGRCGPIDGRRSVEFPKQYPAGVFTAWRGLYFDEDTWDGSDFFMSCDGTGWKLVSQEVVQTFKRAKVRGMSFELMSAVELSFRPE